MEEGKGRKNRLLLQSLHASNVCVDEAVFPIVRSPRGFQSLVPTSLYISLWISKISIQILLDYWIMALRPALTKWWKSVSVVRKSEGKRCFASTTSSIEEAHHNVNVRMKNEYMKGELAPIYMVLGMVMLALSFGTHTAKQQLMHSPTVNVSKKKREIIPEVEDPDTVLDSADNFLNRSFFRKLAHIQDNTTLQPDPFTRPRNAETLKTAGVDPSRHY